VSLSRLLRQKRRYKRAGNAGRRRDAACVRSVLAGSRRGMPLSGRDFVALTRSPTNSVSDAAQQMAGIKMSIASVYPASVPLNRFLTPIAGPARPDRLAIRPQPPRADARRRTWPCGSSLASRCCPRLYPSKSSGRSEMSRSRLPSTMRVRIWRTAVQRFPLSDSAVASVVSISS
jgi:hypothetical protein